MAATGEPMPLASCIMPTANRRAFVPQAIRHFLDQDYSQAELIILDDGDDPVGDLVPDDARLRYIRAPRFTTLGAKRNAAIEAAKGELILHWDDDDWYAPHRIGAQVRALLASDADLCGLDQPLFADPKTRKAWRYVYPAGGAPWVHGATLCYRRTFWRERQFGAVTVGEDNRFAASAPPHKLHRMTETEFFVGLIHVGNTSRKNVNDPRWRPYDFQRIQAITGDAWHSPKSAPTPRPATGSQMGSALVATACGVGDILRTTPLIRALALLGHRVDVVVAPDNPAAADLLRGAPEINALYVVPDTSRGHAPPLPEAVRTHGYAFAGFTRWAAPLASQIKAARTVHFQPGQWLAAGDTSCVTGLAQAAGWSGPLPPPFAMTSGRDFALPPGTVGLHPGCKPDWPWKRWHGFAELAAALHQVAVLGSASDRDTTGTYFKAPFVWPAHVRDFTGALSLADTASLISQCAAVVANDSGLMHLAVALGVPTIGLFGITSPAREAMDSPHMHAHSKGLSCEEACRKQAWGRRDCSQHLECLKTLTPDEVLNRLASIAPEVIELPPGPPSVSLPRPRTAAQVRTEPVKLAVHMEGGLGDILVASRLVEAAHLALNGCQIDVYYHSPEAARFVFRGAPFVRGVHSDRGGFHPEQTHDLSLYTQHYAHFAVYKPERLQHLGPEAAAWIRAASERFAQFRGFYERRPSLDGLWGRLSTRQGRNILDNLGYLSGLPVDRRTPAVICPDPMLAETALGLLSGITGAYVTVHDGFDNTANIPAGKATKCWPIEAWGQMVALLRAARPDIRIIQLGAAKSRPIPGVCRSLIGRTSLDQTAWILKGASLHIDTDSGLTHLAQSLHTRAIVLFGPTDSGLYGYEGNINLRAGDCADCWWSTPDWLSRCPRGLAAPACMSAITPELVVDTTLGVLNSALEPTGTLVASDLYDAPPQGDAANQLKSIFLNAGLPPTPITAHARDRISGLYLHASKQWEYIFALRALDYCPETKAGAPRRILDIGGGRGALSAHLAALGCEVHVIDPDFRLDSADDPDAPQHFLQCALSLGVSARRGAAHNLPVQDDSFDIVLCVSHLSQLRRKDLAIREMLRVLRPGGILGLTFDLSLTPEAVEDGVRVEVLSSQRLVGLGPFNLERSPFSDAQVLTSAECAARDRVAGLPEGLTVGGLLIQKT